MVACMQDRAAAAPWAWLPTFHATLRCPGTGVKRAAELDDPSRLFRFQEGFVPTLVERAINGGVPDGAVAALTTWG
jgi:hypothetical protein